MVAVLLLLPGRTLPAPPVAADAAPLPYPLARPVPTLRPLCARCSDDDDAPTLDARTRYGRRARASLWLKRWYFRIKVGRVPAEGGPAHCACHGTG